MSTKTHNLIKIGFTDRHPTTRAKELDGTSSPHPHVVEYAALATNPYQVEQEVHRRLSDKNESKEWFSCSINEAITSIRIVGKDLIDYEEIPYERKQDILRKASEAQRKRENEQLKKEREDKKKQQSEEQYRRREEERLNSPEYLNAQRIRVGLDTTPFSTDRIKISHEKNYNREINDLKKQLEKSVVWYGAIVFIGFIYFPISAMTMIIFFIHLVYAEFYKPASLKRALNYNCKKDNLEKELSAYRESVKMSGEVVHFDRLKNKGLIRSNQTNETFDFVTTDAVYPDINEGYFFNFVANGEEAYLERYVEWFHQ